MNDNDLENPISVAADDKSFSVDHNNEYDLATRSPQEEDEEGFDGSMTNPGVVEENDTLDNAKSMGIIPDNADEEHPAPLNSAAAIERAEKDH